MGVNDAVEGEYILRAVYTSGRTIHVEKEKTVYVCKPDDRLTYMDVGLAKVHTTDEENIQKVTEDGVPGVIIPVSYAVPIRTTDGTVQTTDEILSIRELANQWRVPEELLTDCSPYDIVPGIRNEQGNAIDIAKARDKGIKLEFEITYPDGSAPKGVDLSQVGQTGKFSFNSNTPKNAKVNCRITATYPTTGDKQYSYFVEYRFTFTREESYLSRIIINPQAGKTGYEITVPLRSEGDVNQLLSVVPIDQYGSQWNWDLLEEAYTPGHRLNPDYTDYDPWSVYVADGKYTPNGVLPEGISLGGQNNTILTVTTEAETCEFQIYAKFSSCSSLPVTVKVNREPSKPTTIQNFTYNGTNQVQSPNQSEADVSYSTQIEAYDQYDALMTEYTVDWKLRLSDSAAASYVTLGEDGLLTVKSCAPNCKATVTAVVRANGSSKSKSTVVEIKRADPVPASVTIERASVPYPAAADTETAITRLAASGRTQYGENQTFQSTDLTWILESVEFADGTTLVRATTHTDSDGDTVEDETGQIPYDETLETYSDSRGALKLTKRGILSFNRISQAGDVPKRIEVTVKCTNGITDRKWIMVSMAKLVPTQIYIPPRDDYKNGIQKPAQGDTVTVDLEAYVQDQYGVVMDEREAPITWSYTGTDPVPQGITVKAGEKKVLIDYNAPDHCSIPMTAKCGSLEYVLYLSTRQDFTLEVQSVEVTTLKSSSGTVQQFKPSTQVTVPLTAKTGPEYEKYDLGFLVRDQFRNPFSRNAIWTVEDATPGVDARIRDGSLRVYFTEQARSLLAGGGDATVTIRATSEDNPLIYGEGIVHLTLASPVVTYAQPVMTDPGEYETDEVTGMVKPVVPQRGSPANRVTVEATVYDQYGQPMAGEKADLQLTTPGIGLSFQQTSGTNQGVLSIENTVTGLSAYIQATPKGKPNNVRDESTLWIQLGKGTSYLYGLSLHKSNVYDFEIPTWNSTQIADAPSPDNVEQLPLRAEVVDQYDSHLAAISATYHPVWEFVGDHTGVEFATGDDDSDGIAEGEDIVLDITNRAVGQGKSTNTVTLRVSTSNITGDENFVKTVTLNLSCGQQPIPTYLYITGADENGVYQGQQHEDGSFDGGLMRPYAEDRSLTYQFGPVVYDQYGMVVEDAEIAIDVDTSPLDDRKEIVIETKYARGESAEKGDRPINFKFFKLEDPEDEKSKKTLMAEFSRETGELVVYTECDILTELDFSAVYAPLGEVGVKKLRLPILTEELRPHTVKVIRSQGDFIISGQKENINDYIRPEVYDQYGQLYTGGVSISWALLLAKKDSAGNYLPYNSDLDEDGNERLPSHFLLLKSDSRDGTTTVTCQPESFFEPRQFMLQCIVIDNRYAADTTRWLYQYTPVNVRRPFNGGSGAMIIFDPGEYGKLVGPSQYPMEPGEPAPGIPGVKTVEGYGFVGWTSDGKTLVDPRKIPLFSETIYMAVYKDVASGKFLEGYNDGTIRPGNPVTRAEFVTMLVRAMGEYEAETDYGNSFRDVEKGKWYANYIAFAKKKGIAGGYPDGTFRPNASITRAEAAKLLAEAIGLSGGAEQAFQDVEPGQWYFGYVQALAETGVVEGYGDGTYRPQRKITRAEAVKLIIMLTDNALNDLERENIQEYAYCPFEDVRKGNWAYAYILRAAGIA